MQVKSELFSVVSITIDEDLHYGNAFATWFGPDRYLTDNNNHSNQRFAPWISTIEVETKGSETHQFISEW